MFSLFQRLGGVGLPVFFLMSFQANANECPELNSYRDLIACIAVRSPNIRRTDIEVQIAEAEVDRAGQFANPELATRNLWATGGSSRSDFANETQLLFPLQLGGKRSARGQVARAQRDSAASLAQSTREKTLVESAQALHRLRQLETEVYLATEAIERFERIIGAFRRRPQLNPEQSVSLTTFKYALEEEKQKRAQGLAEQSSILSDLSVILGQKILAKKEIFPKLPDKWPSVERQALDNSAELKFARARSEEASAQRELARAEAWPDLKIGPSYERMPDRDRTEERIGLGLSLELPLFNRNQAGKRSAELSREAAMLESEFVTKAGSAKLDNLIEQYSLITKALASAPSQSELEKGHRAFETQFSRGLVSYSLIIEAHRQLHDTVETKHKQEITALNLLWSIYKLTGRLTPEAL